MKLDEILNSIAIEEAPKGLVYRWKLRVGLEKELVGRKLLYPYIILPFILAGVWCYLMIFQKNLFSYYLTDRFPWLLDRILFFLSKITYSLNFQIWTIALSFLVALLSLTWYLGRELGWRRAPIRF